MVNTQSLINLESIEYVKHFSKIFKTILFPDVNLIILTIKPDKKDYYITTIWESHDGLPFNICSDAYHVNIKESEQYINERLKIINRSRQIN